MPSIQEGASSARERSGALVQVVSTHVYFKLLTFNRARPGAPKPNKNFLRNIIRQTDSHNAALLAREAEESRARLRSLHPEWEREKPKERDREHMRSDGRLSPLSGDRAGRRRYKQDQSDTEDDYIRRRRRYRDKEDGSTSHRYRERSRDRSRDRDSHRRKRRAEESDDEQRSRKSRKYKSNRDDKYGREHGREDDRKRHSRAKYSDRKVERLQGSARSRSRSPKRRTDSRPPKERSRSRSRSPRRSRRSLTSDSDPLEAILGPLPPPSEPVLRSRGRGAHRANAMGIESRFSSTYDPSIDVPASEGDEWGDSVEAFRDRQRWKQQGADRLKAAGFSDAQIKKWEKGDEPNEEDVVWTRQGEKREWDRGKVVDEEGDVQLKAELEFGRLK